MNTTLKDNARITLPQAISMTADKEYYPGEGTAPVGQTAIARAKDILDLMGHAAPDDHGESVMHFFRLGGSKLGYSVLGSSGMSRWEYRMMVNGAFNAVVNPHDRKAEVCMIELVAECLRHVDDDDHGDLGEKDEEVTWAGGSIRQWRRSREVVYRVHGITTWAVMRDGSLAGRATTIRPGGAVDAVKAVDRDLAAAGIPSHDEYAAIAMPAGWYLGGFGHKRKNEIKLVSKVKEQGLSPVPIIIERDGEANSDH